MAALRINPANLFRTGADRPNLFFEVEARALDPLNQIYDWLAARGLLGTCGIIYVVTRDDSERLSRNLDDRGLATVYYHGGMGTLLRRAAQESWSNGIFDICVATTAFGMGIDKPDVRFVIILALTRTVEEFYQQAGRAGRDGQPASVLLLYSPADVGTLKRIAEYAQTSRDISAVDPQLARKVAAMKETGLQNMLAFAQNAHVCRRVPLLAHFDEVYPPGGCGACDICLPPVAAPLARYLPPFRRDIGPARSELSAGRKKTHWIWWIFPQLLCPVAAVSDRNRQYALNDFVEADAFLAHPVLGPGLVELTNICLGHARAGVPIASLFGGDVVKFVSSMTAFALATPPILGCLDVHLDFGCFEAALRAFRQQLCPWTCDCYVAERGALPPWTSR